MNFFEDTQYKNKCLMQTGRQIMYQLRSLFNINKSQGDTVNLNDLLNVDLYNDNLKMFNQDWEETF